MAKCILIYDDDAVLLFLCKTLLIKSKYQVETFSNCENVLNDIAVVKPAIILIDLCIPGCSGAKAVVLIKTAAGCKA